MSGIYIKGMEMPTTGLYLVSVDNSCGEDETVMTVKRMLGNRDVCQIIGAYNLVPVPEHGRLLKVLKTERECVSRDCDRDCEHCDLSLEREEIVGVYDALIVMLIPADKEERMTWGDKIRAMTDEELAKWLCVMNIDDCPDKAHERHCMDKCYECWLDWLKSPAEVYNG